MVSVAVHCGTAVFSTSGFHRLFATKPIGSETSKAGPGRSVSTKVLSLGLVAHSFFGLSERAWGYEPGRRPRHAGPNSPAETRSRTRGSPESHQPPPEEIPGKVRTRSEKSRKRRRGKLLATRPMRSFRDTILCPGLTSRTRPERLRKARRPHSKAQFIVHS